MQTPVPDAGGQREREDQVGGGAQRAPQDPQEEQTARQVTTGLQNKETVSRNVPQSIEV